MLTLQDRLRTARKAAKLTQAQLARLAGIDRSTYVHIERGDRNPSFKAATGIARAHNKSAEDVLLLQYMLL
ncbi:MAG: helix-turn-helix domain-containing protein [Bacillota bacterium]